jgi:hypothetical protein
MGCLMVSYGVKAIGEARCTLLDVLKGVDYLIGRAGWCWWKEFQLRSRPGVAPSNAVRWDKWIPLSGTLPRLPRSESGRFLHVFAWLLPGYSPACLPSCFLTNHYFLGGADLPPTLVGWSLWCRGCAMQEVVWLSSHLIKILKIRWML